MNRFLILIPVLLILTACDMVNVRVVDKFVVDYVNNYEVIIRTDFLDNPRFVKPIFKVRFGYNYSNRDYNVTCDISEPEFSALNVGDIIPVSTSFPVLTCNWIMRMFNDDLIKRVNSEK